MWNTCDPLALNALEVIAYFAQPTVATSILIHLVSDGITDFSTDPKFIQIHLVSEDNVSHHVFDSENVVLSCSENPVTFKVTHDLSQPLFKTKAIKLSFSSPTIQVEGIRLRSWRYIDPKIIQSCAREVSSISLDINFEIMLIFTT